MTSLINGFVLSLMYFDYGGYRNRADMPRKKDIQKYEKINFSLKMLGSDFSEKKKKKGRVKKLKLIPFFILGFKFKLEESIRFFYL